MPVFSILESTEEKAITNLQHDPLQGSSDRLFRIFVDSQSVPGACVRDPRCIQLSLSSALERLIPEEQRQWGPEISVIYRFLMRIDGSAGV